MDVHVHACDSAHAVVWIQINHVLPIQINTVIGFFEVATYGFTGMEIKLYNRCVNWVSIQTVEWTTGMEH